MAIDNTGISSLDTGAHDITYSGNEGPKSPEENREIALSILGDEVGEVASQLWNGMSPSEKSEWRSIEGFIQSEDFKIILMQLKSKQQGRGGLQTASAADDMLQDEYDKYVFEMQEMGQQPMSLEDFRQQAVAGMATGGRVPNIGPSGINSLNGWGDTGGPTDKSYGGGQMSSRDLGETQHRNTQQAKQDRAEYERNRAIREHNQRAADKAKAAREEVVKEPATFKDKLIGGGKTLAELKNARDILTRKLGIPIGYNQGIGNPWSNPNLIYNETTGEFEDQSGNVVDTTMSGAKQAAELKIGNIEEPWMKQPLDVSKFEKGWSDPIGYKKSYEQIPSGITVGDYLTGATSGKYGHMGSTVLQKAIDKGAIFPEKIFPEVGYGYVEPEVKSRGTGSFGSYIDVPTQAEAGGAGLETEAEAALRAKGWLAQGGRAGYKNGYSVQGGVKNYLGDQEMVHAPKHWQSAPDHPKTELAYITDAEKDLILKKDLHNSI